MKKVSHKKKKGTLLKKGRFSGTEMEFMQANESTLTVEEMAEKMNRAPVTVQAWLNTNNAILGRGDHDTVYTIRKELRESLAWRRLREELLPSEVCYFEEQYISFMKQFRDDVTATEQSQIFQAIKLDILMGRNLKQRRRTLEDVERLEKLQEELVRSARGNISNLTEENRMLVMDLTTQINAGRASEGAKTTEYTRLQEKYESIIQALKATRQQRITKIENEKENFISILKMLQNEELREQEGRALGLLQMAVAQEKERLSEAHTFADGQVDHPLLSAEVLEHLDERSDDAP